MKKSVHDKLQSIGSAPHFNEPHESFAKTKSDASNVEVKTGHPHSNLGKFLHPKKGYTPNLGKPAASINKTVDANTGGHKVRHTQ